MKHLQILAAEDCAACKKFLKKVPELENVLSQRGLVGEINVYHKKSIYDSRPEGWSAQLPNIFFPVIALQSGNEWHVYNGNYNATTSKWSPNRKSLDANTIADWIKNK